MLPPPLTATRHGKSSLSDIFKFDQRRLKPGRTVETRKNRPAATPSLRPPYSSLSRARLSLLPVRLSRISLISRWRKHGSASPGEISTQISITHIATGSSPTKLGKRR